MATANASSNQSNQQQIALSIGKEANSCCDDVGPSKVPSSINNLSPPKSRFSVPDAIRHLKTFLVDYCGETEQSVREMTPFLVAEKALEYLADDDCVLKNKYSSGSSLRVKMNYIIDALGVVDEGQDGSGL